MSILKFYTDGKRHLVCLPYNIENLHLMAVELRLHSNWFHNGRNPHYDLPIRRMKELEEKCIIVSSKDIVKICKGEYHE